MAETEDIREEERPSPRGESPASPGAIREHLAGLPGPTVPTDYDVDEALFWQRRHLPAGSVMEFSSPIVEGGESAFIAVMVLDMESKDSGIWVDVKVLGASTPAEKKEADKYFKGNRRQVHICYPDKVTGICPRDHDDALHIRKFRWFPAGDYDSPWLSASARKTVTSGKKLEAQWLERRAPPPRTSTRGAGKGGPSEVEKRLSALRGDKTRRVSFADKVEYPGSRRREEGRPPELDGAGGDRRGSSLEAVVLRTIK
eukprot:s1957_g19.t1